MTKPKPGTKPRKFDKDSFTREEIEKYGEAEGLPADWIDLVKRAINTSYSDLVERTGLPLNTVKSRLARARLTIGAAKEAAK